MMMLCLGYVQVYTKPMLYRFITLFSSLILIVGLLLSTACQPQSENRIYERESPYSFEDTILNLDIAISEYNYRIIHRSHIGQAVRDRGDSSFPLSTITSFCNITYAKEMIEINPLLIYDMPCNIAVWETQDGKVMIGTTLMSETVPDPAQKQFAQKINANLKGIIGATIE
jgi:uncharacterized protein (DUF302 family)